MARAQFTNFPASSSLRQPPVACIEGHNQHMGSTTVWHLGFLGRNVMVSGVFVMACKMDHWIAWGLFIMDLSPGNIAVTSTGMPCVIDLGGIVMMSNSACYSEGQSLTLVPDQEGFFDFTQRQASYLHNFTAIGPATRWLRSELLAEHFRIEQKHTLARLMPHNGPFGLLQC